MHVSYDLNIEDLVSMNVYNFKTAPVWQRQQRTTQLALALVMTFLCFGITTLISRTITPLNIGIAIVAGALFFILYPRLFEPAFKKRLTQFFQSDSGSGMVGKYTLALEENSVSQSTQTSTNTYQWDQVERLDVTEQHLYLFAGKSNCITVPRARLNTRDIETIIEIVKAHNIPTNRHDLHETSPP
jgi:hypothetical protein